MDTKIKIKRRKYILVKADEQYGGGDLEPIVSSISEPLSEESKVNNIKNLLMKKEINYDVYRDY